ncbi:MAG: hypothetical protein Q4G04_00435 [bacterium]|nr:hypothetical protein [bacterium]
MYLSFKDLFIVFVKALFLTAVITLLFFLGFQLIRVNINISDFLCNWLNIPKELALTVMSPGFGIEINILLLFFETIIITLCFNKLSNTKLFLYFYDIFGY